MKSYETIKKLIPEPGQPIYWMAIGDAIPELHALAVTPQNPEWHAEGDVLTHTKMVCEKMITLPEYAAADATRRQVLFLAALLHDIAKPSCTVTDGDGRISSAGHSRRGAVDARIMLWRADAPFELRERVCRLIGAHQLPYFVFSPNKANLTPEYMVIKLSCEMSLIELATLAEADARGRICKDTKATQATLDNIELFREMARNLNCYESEYSFPDKHTRLAYLRSEGKISPDYPVYKEPGSKVIMLSGLPAAGKDTMAAKLGLPVVSFDDNMAQLGFSHGDKGSGTAIHLTIDQAKQLLRQKAPFIWNATHLSELMRKKTLDLLYAYNADVEIVYLESPEHVIHDRNSKRDSTLTNNAITKMLFKWEVPALTEAHDVRYEVAKPTKNPHRKPL